VGGWLGLSEDERRGGVEGAVREIVGEERGEGRE